MYYPKSQITSNLYTEGDLLVYDGTNIDYIGFYWKTSNEEYYSGKNPQDLPNKKLALIGNNQFTTNQSNIDQSTYDINNANFASQTSTYFTLDKDYITSNTLGIDNSTLPPLTPISITPTPTEDDYNTGDFTRYFLKKSNESKFIEINKFVYDQYLNEDNEVSYQLYIPFKLNWVLTGEKEIVKKENTSTILITERKNKLYGLSLYFSKKYLQFYKPSSNISSEESLGNTNIGY